MKKTVEGEEMMVPEPIFVLTPDGVKKPVGGTTPTVEETQLFLLQAVRGAVEYEPHPVWGEKVLVPVQVEGVSEGRLRELSPLTYRSIDEVKKLLKAQIRLSKIYLEKQCPGLPKFILNAMDF